MYVLEKIGIPTSSMNAKHCNWSVTAPSVLRKLKSARVPGPLPNGEIAAVVDVFDRTLYASFVLYKPTDLSLPGSPFQ